MLLVNSGSDTEIIFSKVHIQNCSAPKHWLERLLVI
jgi:hypothetical protein